VMAPVKLKRFPKARFPVPPAPAHALPPFPFPQPFRDKPPPHRTCPGNDPLSFTRLLRRKDRPEITIPLPIRFECPFPPLPRLTTSIHGETSVPASLGAISPERP
jgi:hypothetical protein